MATLAGGWSFLKMATSETVAPTTAKKAAKPADGDKPALTPATGGKAKEVAKKEPKKAEPPKSKAQKLAEKEAKAKEDAVRAAPPPPESAAAAAKLAAAR